MCAACVAQGVVYVGGALTGLQVMAARAKARRRADDPDTAPPEAHADKPEPLTSAGARSSPAS